MSTDADWADPKWVSAVMLFPHDVDSRRTFCDRLSMDRIKPDGFLTIDSETGRRLARADGLGSRLVDMTRHGYVVGQFMFMLYGMHRFPENFPEPSARKVIKCLDHFLLRARFKDGTPVSRTPQAIKDYFKELEDVAHLWGASVLLRDFVNRPKLLETRGELNVLESCRKSNEFLGIARMLEIFGCEFKQKRTKSGKPLLNANTLWRVPDSIVPLAPRWPVPPERLIKAMISYKARPKR